MRGEFEHRVDLLAVHAREPLQEIIHRGTILQILEKSLHRHAGPAEDKSPAHRVRRGVHFRAIGPIEHGDTIVRARVTCNLRPPRPLWSLIFSRGQSASARLPWRQLVCTRYQLVVSSDPSSLGFGYATPQATPGATASAPGEVFTIPLEDGKFATIPYPMSPQTWELFMQTLTLWKPRLVAQEQPNE